MYSLCLEMLLPYQLPTAMKVGACFLCFLEQIVVGRTGMETLTNEAGEVTRYTNISQDAVTMFLELVFFFNLLFVSQSPARYVQPDNKVAGGRNQASVNAISFPLLPL